MSMCMNWSVWNWKKGCGFLCAIPFRCKPSNFIEKKQSGLNQVALSVLGYVYFTTVFIPNFIFDFKTFKIFFW